MLYEGKRLIYKSSSSQKCVSDLHSNLKANFRLKTTIWIKWYISTSNLYIFFHSKLFVFKNNSEHFHWILQRRENWFQLEFSVLLRIYWRAICHNRDQDKKVVSFQSRMVISHRLTRTPSLASCHSYSNWDQVQALTLWKTNMILCS